MDEIAGVGALQKLKSKPLASMEGVEATKEVQLAAEVREVRELQTQVADALQEARFIRAKIEAAYEALSPQN